MKNKFNTPKKLVFYLGEKKVKIEHNGMLLWYRRDMGCAQITPLACEAKITKLRFLMVPESRREQFLRRKGMLFYIGSNTKEDRANVSNYHISLGGNLGIRWHTHEATTTPWPCHYYATDAFYCYWPEEYGKEIKP